MNRFSLPVFTALTLAFTALSLTPPHSVEAKQTGHGYEFEGNGKRKFACGQTLYTAQAQLPDERMDLGPYKAGLNLAVQRQAPILKASGGQRWRAGGLAINRRGLDAVARQVAALPSEIQLSQLTHSFTPYLIHGEDGCGNTHFTAYFAPLIQVKARPDKLYKYPLYRKPARWPQGRPPSREEIDGQRVLAGRGLEIAYAKDLLEIFFLQVQGSGLAEYLDTGEKVTFQFGGQNGMAYSSLGRYLVDQGYVPAEDISLNAIRDFFAAHPDKLESFLYRNQSYTFFNKRKAGPKGSLNSEVVPKISIAVDPKFIPLGAVLLAEVPQLNAQGELQGHQWRLLVAQDTGGAIRGPGHVDLFMGGGLKAQAEASNMHHYGRLWLLMPKR